VVSFPLAFLPITYTRSSSLPFVPQVKPSNWWKMVEGRSTLFEIRNVWKISWQSSYHSALRESIIYWVKKLNSHLYLHGSRIKGTCNYCKWLLSAFALTTNIFSIWILNEIFCVCVCMWNKSYVTYDVKVCEIFISVWKNMMKIVPAINFFQQFIKLLKNFGQKETFCGKKW
jgi:hypothetical protein